MLAISFIIMYTVMFLNVDEANHIYLSLTRTYMSLLMVSPMALIMLLMMGKMYPDKKLNGIIVVASIVVFVTSLSLLRTQIPVSDVQYIHEGNDTTSFLCNHDQQECKYQRPGSKKLSEGIIATQEIEIAEMKAILERMNK